jgi:hypothetical protein
LRVQVIDTRRAPDASAARCALRDGVRGTMRGGVAWQRSEDCPMDAGVETFDDA